MRVSAAILAALVLVFSGCSRRTETVERLAIPPFENLGEDPSADWIGRAAAEVLAAQLAVSRSTHAVPVAAARDAPAVRATRMLHGHFSALNGRLVLGASLEQVDRRRTVESFSAEGPLEQGILPLLDSIARRLDPLAQPFGTKDPEALRAYVDARSVGDAAAAAAAYERAVGADPDFGAAYSDWARLLSAQGDRAGAERVIAAARKRGEGISEVDRARIEWISAAVRQDAQARRGALVALAALTPADADIYRLLGREEIARGESVSAVQWLIQATELDPANPLLWNDLGYAEALHRNLQGARDALNEYDRLAPKEANPMDSLGDVHFYLGDFTSAEQFYLQAYQRSATFLGGATLYKAARSRLIAGDLESADKIFMDYLKNREQAGDPILGYREAQWDHLAGRHERARERLTGFATQAGLPPDVASQAYSQLSVWTLAAGDLAGARRFAERAAAAAASPVSRNLAALCRFLAESPAPPRELALRAETRFEEVAQLRTKTLALAYALLLGQHFRDAEAPLRDLLREADPLGAEQFRVLLAWVLVETGRHQEAASLLETFWIPSAGEPVFAFLAVPRVFHLRSVVFDKLGRAEEAQRNASVYRALSGE